MRVNAVHFNLQIIRTQSIGERPAEQVMRACAQLAVVERARGESLVPVGHKIPSRYFLQKILRRLIMDYAIAVHDPKKRRREERR